MDPTFRGMLMLAEHLARDMFEAPDRTPEIDELRVEGLLIAMKYITDYGSTMRLFGQNSDRKIDPNTTNIDLRKITEEDLSLRLILLAISEAKNTLPHHLLTDLPRARKEELVESFFAKTKAQEDLKRKLIEIPVEHFHGKQIRLPPLRRK